MRRITIIGAGFAALTAARRLARLVGGPGGAPARALSLAMASLFATVVLVFPPALVGVSHGLLSLVMAGMAVGFVHGVGFIPESRRWRLVFGPLVAWPLNGLALALAARGLAG